MKKWHNKFGARTVTPRFSYNKRYNTMRTQDYKIELIVKADAENSPRDWLKNAQKYGGFPFGECLLKAATPTITKVYSYSVEAIDSSHLDYKFMSDMDKI